ncbi:UDP-glucose 4-epimerase GalE [Enterocloster aldenensis]|uniref:UDP-glucose 4-epimerase GalE n=1 Tax=Enterocloster aldenensis TaxID=358742 RepID=UPI0035177EC7
MILVVGGAGYIGSHTNKEINRRGIPTVIYDNLIYGHQESVKWGIFEKGDVADGYRLDEIFDKYPIESVVHFAAYAYVGESVDRPSKYYNNNVCNTIKLLDKMREHEVHNIVFSSTCATYGEPKQMPITEDMPQNPINPYGASKLMVERILEDYHKAYGINYCCLRYFNAAGADPNGEIGESHNPETHLIPLILDAASGYRKSISIYGTDYPTEDGTCMRDYIHVTDLADAHIRALEYLKSGGESSSFNLGNGKGVSVRHVINAVKAVTGREFQVKEEQRREGDPPILIGSAKKAEAVLGWKPVYGDIETIVEHAWKWHENKNF